MHRPIKATTGRIDHGNRSPPPPCHNRQAMPQGINRIPMICCWLSDSPAKARVSPSTTNGDSPRIRG
ncbi:hypothetical protein D3C79_1056230 [compost metagenome]